MELQVDSSQGRSQVLNWAQIEKKTFAVIFGLERFDNVRIRIGHSRWKRF